MSGLAQFLSVLAIGFVELWAAVPAGIAMGLPAPLVWAATLCGALLGIAAVVIAGDRLRAWLVSRFGHGGAREGGRLVFWLGVGATVWTTVLTVAVALGAEAVTSYL